MQEKSRPEIASIRLLKRKKEKTLFSELNKKKNFSEKWLQDPVLSFYHEFGDFPFIHLPIASVYLFLE